MCSRIIHLSPFLLRPLSLNVCLSSVLDLDSVFNTQAQTKQPFANRHYVQSLGKIATQTGEQTDTRTSTNASKTANTTNANTANTNAVSVYSLYTQQQKHMNFTIPRVVLEIGSEWQADSVCEMLERQLNALCAVEQIGVCVNNNEQAQTRKIPFVLPPAQPIVLPSEETMHTQRNTHKDKHTQATKEETAKQLRNTIFNAKWGYSSGSNVTVHKDLAGRRRWVSANTKLQLLLS